MIVPIPFSPLWKSSLTVLRLKKGTVRFTEEMGREIQCCKCEEWCPGDTEFFNSNKGKPTGLHSLCRPCYNVRWEK